MDPIDEAKAEIKKHAARALARKEQLAEELRSMQERRDALLADRERAEGAGATELLGEIDGVLQTMIQKISLLEEQVALAANTVDEVVSEMRSLDGARSQLERESLVGNIRALTATDPVSADPKDRALANVRAHAAEMEARVELEEELAGKPTSPELRRLQEEQKQADLRAQLDELKAKRRRGAETEAGEGGPPDGDKPKKRTL